MTAEVERHEWVIGDGEAKRRLDHFLVEAGLLGSRSQIRKLIAGGQVRVDGVVAKPGERLRVGQRVVAERPIARAETAAAEAIDLRVLYEDEFLLAVDKPAGLVVHPAPGNWSGTLVNALLHRWRDTPRDLDPERCGIVHRLDKDTSGVILVAKDLETHEAVSRLFRQREVRKQYAAIAYGSPRLDVGEIDAPIGRHRVDRKKMAVRRGGRHAITRYEVIERYRGAALLYLYPLTGRTHQIRVHLASIGHAILDDPVYARGRQFRVELGRQALHAQRLHFTHPRTGEEVRLHAPWPADFARAVEELRSGRESRGGSRESEG
jgi:23S rRNA pseudouridine1911/1915/1917 synthase